MNLSLTRVLRFAAVAEHLSFTRAAAALGIDQPWLSRQVMQLEDQLGFTLFDRSGPKIELTPEGQEFHEAALLVAAAARQVRDKAEEMSRRAQSSVRVGASYTTFAVETRHRLIARYAELRPNVRIEFTAWEWSDDVVAAALAGTIDFGIVFGPLDHPDLEIAVLERIDMTLAVPREDPLSQAPSVALADLAGRRVAFGLKDANAAGASSAYSWIDRVGAIKVHIPEGRRFIFDAACRERLVVGCYTSADKLPDDFVRRPIRGPKPTINVCLIRNRRVMSTPATRFWRLGEEMAVAAPAETPVRVDP